LSGLALGLAAGWPRADVLGQDQQMAVGLVAADQGGRGRWGGWGCGGVDGGWGGGGGGVGGWLCALAGRQGEAAEKEGTEEWKAGYGGSEVGKGQGVG